MFSEPLQLVSNGRVTLRQPGTAGLHLSEFFAHGRRFTLGRVTLVFQQLNVARQLLSLASL